MTPQRTHHPRRFARLLSVAAAMSAVALAGPVAGASALTPPAFPALPALPAAALPGAALTGAALPAALPLPVPLAGNALGGSTNGIAGCVGTNRPSVGGNNGSTSAQTCGAILSFSGPQIGQISATIGPTIIGSPASNVIVSAGSVTAPVQVP
jgi:hypothetical protein